MRNWIAALIGVAALIAVLGAGVAHAHGDSPQDGWTRVRAEVRRTSANVIEFAVSGINGAARLDVPGIGAQEVYIINNPAIIGATPAPYPDAKICAGRA